ncbi:serine/threonine-protein phosphatase 4 regulatory subunit 2-like [Drosophila biarmipes]|uniref:serine/threonine-protein phosphatase 4 regulatory subunit 2-like n=1 Tax=Drosophila biarmipes TaxID=125945 RepID=UPI0007E5DC3C|nr:serine/threonine-protein phosphatase 4 regulatory subunit 2-like [Drosophila biarmipes]
MSANIVTMKDTYNLVRSLHFFTLHQDKLVPPELENYLQYVALTGDNIFTWSSLKYLVRQMLCIAIFGFYRVLPRDAIPTCPKFGPFNFEGTMYALLWRLDRIDETPYTFQRLCELLTEPQKHYSRIDKFMRAVEKVIVVHRATNPKPQSIEIDVLDPETWSHIEKLSQSIAEEASAPGSSARKNKKSKKAKKDKKAKKEAEEPSGSGLQGHATGQEGHATGQEGHATGQEGHATGQEGHATGQEGHAT